jgi:hypothetical protein
VPRFTRDHLFTLGLLYIITWLFLGVAFGIWSYDEAKGQIGILIGLFASWALREVAMSRRNGPP